jgi:hypothetical protein
MPFVTVARKVKIEEKDEVYYPEIKWAIAGKDHKAFYEGQGNVGGYGHHKHQPLSDISTIVIEQAPRNRTINFRHSFYSGDKYTEYHLAIPWTYYLARVNTSGTILISAMFFANEEIKTTKQKGLCCAPMPNFDYGKDHGLGVCLWKAGKKFGKSRKEAAVKCHEYIWTSDFNPGVGYYDEGRPKEIQASSWPASLEKWQELTLAKKPITWVPVGAKCKYPGPEPTIGRDAETIDDAFEWLCKTADYNYR